MKNRIKYLALLLIIISFNSVLLAQQNSKLQRKVQYTLGVNEILDYNEYTIISNLNGYYFAAFIKNTQTGETSLVFNGIKVVQNMIEYYYMKKHYALYLNPLEPKGYSLGYKRKTGYFINISGVEKGPYEEIRLFSKNHYAYKLASKWFDCINGKVSGPYIGGVPLYKTDKGEYAFIFHDDGYNWFVNINGDVKNGESVRALDCVMKNSGFWGYSYNGDDNNGKDMYFNIDGKTYGPYRNVSRLDLTENGKFAFMMLTDQYGKWGNFANINGKILGPFSGLIQKNDIDINEKAEYIFAFEKEDDKSYINYNGQIMGPFTYCKDVNINENGDYAFLYYGSNEPFYVKNNNTIFGPYEYVTELVLLDNGTASFIYEETEGKWYVHYNGDNLGPYKSCEDLKIEGASNISYKFSDGISYNSVIINNNGTKEEIEWLNMAFESFELYNTNKAHSFISDQKYDYVVIDGEMYGKSPALNAYFDKRRNSFIWNSIEGKELVVYEYKL